MGDFRLCFWNIELDTLVKYLLCQLSARKHSVGIRTAALVALMLCTAVLRAGQYESSTLSRMPIKDMKNEFCANGSKYCALVRQEAAPYITEVCRTLADTALYNRRLAESIVGLKHRLAVADTPKRRYEVMEMLYRKYVLLEFNKAYGYATACEKEARKMGDRNLTARAMTYQMESLTKSGFFREAEDTRQRTDTCGCSRATRVAYVMASFNMEFENGFYFPRSVSSHSVYIDHMRRYAAEMERLVAPDSYLIDDMKVKLCFQQMRYDEAVEHSKRLLDKIPTTSEYYAYALGNMGYNYMGMHDYANAARCVAQSAIMEIKRGSVEYPAARKIAEIAYIVGDLGRSYLLINVAMQNAEAYHSRYRYSEIASSYPKIDNDLYAYTQRQKTRLTVGLVVLVIATLMLVAAVIVMIRQARALHRQKTLIEQQMTRISDKSKLIERINSELQEAGHIKEVVLGQLIVGSANHQAAVEKLRKEVLRRLTIKDYDGLRSVFDAQRGAAFDSFYHIDNILLMLYPDFCEKFNALLRPECRITPKREERLSTEMRIFALICLGITKNEDLARSLNYSVNTIKSYKTRIVNASLYDKEEFYERLKKGIVAEIP